MRGGWGFDRRCSAHVFFDVHGKRLRERCESTHDHGGPHIATRIVQALTPTGEVYDTLMSLRWLDDPLRKES